MRKILPALALLVFVSGCDDFSSPQGVMGTAYQAVQKNDLKLFRETLMGDALERHGSAEGLSALKTRLAGLEPRVEKVHISRVERDRRGWTTLREYHLDIKGVTPAPRKGSLVGPLEVRLAATVNCYVSYVYKERWGAGYPPYYPYPGHPGPDYDCQMREGHLGYCHFDELESCRIARLE